MNDVFMISIALVILVGVLVVTALIKYDVDGFLKVWGVAGTLLFTVATYYLTDQLNERELSSINGVLTLTENSNSKLSEQLISSKKVTEEVRNDINRLLNSNPITVSPAKASAFEAMSMGDVKTKDKVMYNNWLLREGLEASMTKLDSNKG